MQVVYGVTISLAGVMMVGALLVAFCKRVNCRYLIYVACFFIFFVALMGFAMSVMFSIVTPMVYFGCDFIDYSLASSANFECKP